MLESSDGGEAHVLSGEEPGDVDGGGGPLGWEAHYQAASAGFVLYLSRPRDLDALAAFARLLGHPATATLGRAYIHYVGPGPGAPLRARRHFAALRRQRATLRGLALYEGDAALATPALPALEDQAPADPRLREHAWQRGALAAYYSDDA